MIKKRLREARKLRQDTKLNADALRQQFLQDRAEDYTQRTRTTQETALHAII
jgi:hypothetical protein